MLLLSKMLMAKGEAQSVWFPMTCESLQMGVFPYKANMLTFKET